VFAAYGALVTGAQLIAFRLGGVVTSLIGPQATLLVAAGCGISVVLVGVGAYACTEPDGVVSAA
jgi:hypothetical protein